ncbi:MAG: hypothetical protein BWX70_01342 [Verrucomicrobia bacterium ADurb.Bin070]|nr:MAG: hypothetical protein BWX70_01342 [Verrucomicrobia bacterium ADurb.Bin070]
MGRPPACGTKLSDPAPESVTKSRVPVTPRPPASTSRQRNGYGARSTDNTGLASMAVVSGKSAMSASFSGRQAAPLRGCQPVQAAGPPSTTGVSERSARGEGFMSARHTERKKPGRVLAGAGASAGRAANSVVRAKTGLNSSKRDNSPATGPTVSGFGPGVMRPRRGWLKVSPLTVRLIACPVHVARTSYHVFVVTAGPRSRLSHLPSIWTKKARCPPSPCSFTRSRYSPSFKARF